MHMSYALLRDRFDHRSYRRHVDPSGLLEGQHPLFSHAAHAVDNNNIAYRILGNNYAKRAMFRRRSQLLPRPVTIEPGTPIGIVDWVLLSSSKEIC